MLWATGWMALPLGNRKDLCFIRNAVVSLWWCLLIIVPVVFLSALISTPFTHLPVPPESQGTEVIFTLPPQQKLFWGDSQHLLLWVWRWKEETSRTCALSPASVWGWAKAEQKEQRVWWLGRKVKKGFVERRYHQLSNVAKSCVGWRLETDHWFLIIWRSLVTLIKVIYLFGVAWTKVWLERVQGRIRSITWLVFIFLLLVHFDLNSTVVQVSFDMCINFLELP